jgi:TetR/AcrR family transcriptional regulator
MTVTSFPVCAAEAHDKIGFASTSGAHTIELRSGPNGDTLGVMSDAKPRTVDAPNRNARRKARTEAAIIAAAEDVIRRQGFDRASVEEISELADVGIGSIYHHFQSKEGLLLALVERAVETNQTYLASGFDLEGTPIERLAAVQAAYLRFYDDEPFYFDLIILEYERRAGTYAPAAVERISAIAGHTLTQIAELIAEAHAAGEVRPVDPVNAARFLWASLNGLLASSRRGDALALTREDVDLVLASGMGIVLNGLLTRRGMNRLAR